MLEQGKDEQEIRPRWGNGEPGEMPPKPANYRPMEREGQPGRELKPKGGGVGGFFSRFKGGHDPERAEQKPAVPTLLDGLAVQDAKEQPADKTPTAPLTAPEPPAPVEMPQPVEIPAPATADQLMTAKGELEKETGETVHPIAIPAEAAAGHEELSRTGRTVLETAADDGSVAAIAVSQTRTGFVCTPVGQTTLPPRELQVVGPVGRAMPPALPMRGRIRRSGGRGQAQHGPAGKLPELTINVAE